MIDVRDRAAEAGRSTGMPVMAVSTASGPATLAGARILQAGGNAVDAAVAAAFALAVCEPSGSGLGGQASLLMAAPGRAVVAIDGRSVAPIAVTRQSVSRADQRRGYRASTVPSMLAVLARAHSAWGVLAWSTVLRPAVELAAHGFAVTALTRRQLHWSAAALRLDALAARRFLPDGVPPRLGQQIVQPELEATLRRLAVAGADDFYVGEIGRRIVADMAARGGLISAADLAAARFVAVSAPLQWRHGDATVTTAPAPGGGLPLLLALRTTAALADSGTVTDPGRRALLCALATRAAHAVRDELACGDAAGITADLERLVAATVSLCKLDLDSARTPLSPGPDTTAPRKRAEEPGETTHLSVTDSAGMMVALTSSIQSLFGAKVSAEGLGFFWNNYLRTCPRRPSHYQLGAGCRPRSNAAPTIILAPSGTPATSLGSAGSRRITSSLVHVITGMLDHGLSLNAAISAPRMHATTSHLSIERPLEGDGLDHFGPVKYRRPHDYAMGAVHAVQRDRDRRASAAADPRREGLAVTGFLDPAPVGGASR